MNTGDWVETPRFLKVQISEVFDDEETAQEQGFREPTHYWNPEYDIFGKRIESNRMAFAAVRKYHGQGDHLFA